MLRAILFRSLFLLIFGTSGYTLIHAGRGRADRRDGRRAVERHLRQRRGDVVVHCAFGNRRVLGEFFQLGICHGKVTAELVVAGDLASFGGQKGRLKGAEKKKKVGEAGIRNNEIGVVQCTLLGSEASTRLAKFAIAEKR